MFKLGIIFIYIFTVSLLKASNEADKHLERIRYYE